MDALAKHDADTIDTDDLDKDVSFSEAGTESQSISAKTFNTWATNWTDCTNTSFNKVHRYWPSNSSMHKEVSIYVAPLSVKKALNESYQNGLFSVMININ